MSEVLRELGSIARALDAIANIEFQELALTKGQYLYVVRIFEHPGIIPEHLAQLLNVDTSTCSRALKRLVTEGFIEKRQLPTNKKNKQLFVTNKGAQAAQFIQKENRYSEQQALAGMSLEERMILHELLQQMRKNIDTDWQLVKKGQKRPYTKGEHNGTSDD